MKHKRLKELYKKQRKFSILSYGCLVIVLLSFFLAMIMYFFASTIGDDIVLTAGHLILLIDIVCLVIGIVLQNKSWKYYGGMQDYIIIKIMDIINENGISTENFEIIEENSSNYKVAFHNQTINYGALQSQIDTELEEMNKIANRNVRVKLI